MTVSSTTNRVAYSGNGTTTAFTVSFPFLAATDLKVYINTTLQTLTSQYTLSGVGAGATLTFATAPSAGTTVLILRDPALTQLTDYIENDDFPAESHERALDKLTMIAQRLDERGDRAIVLPDTYTGSASTTLPTPVPSTYIGWNSTGDALVASDLSDIATLAAASGFVTQTFSGTGAQLTYTLSSAPGNTSNLEVFVAGTRLTPTTDYTVSGTTLTFVVAPAAGTNNILTRFVQTLPAGTVADLSVTTAKIVDQAVTTAKIADSSVTAVKIADGTITTAKWAAANGPLGMRNALINGAMTISQRGGTFTSTSGANNDDAYTLDRWYILSDGNDVIDVTQNAVSAPSDQERCIALDVETVNKKFGIAQIIEGFNCGNLLGNQVTLSFKAKVSSTTKLDNVKAAIVAWSGTVDSVTSDIVSAWGVEGTNPTLIASAEYENTPTNLGVTTSWATYSVTGLVDTANAKNVIVFIWSDVTDTTLGDFLFITDVQIERGGVATPFERRSYGYELDLCQRYYEFGGCTSVFYSPTTSTIRYMPKTYHVRKRATPSSVDIGSATSIGFDDLGANVTPSTWVVISSDASGFSVHAVYSAVGPPARTLGGHAAFSYRATAEL